MNHQYKVDLLLRVLMAQFFYLAEGVEIFCKKASELWLSLFETPKVDVVVEFFASFSKIDILKR